MTPGATALRFRRAAAPDLPELTRLERAAHAHPWTPEQLRGELSQGFSRVLCAEEPGGEAGALLGFIVYWVIHDELHVLDVVTSPEARRRGVGRALMREALGDGLRRGALRALLEVRRSNTPAIALYAALGFVEDAIRRGYYQDGEDAILMSLSLDHLPG